MVKANATVVIILLAHFYRPHTKYREGYVFSVSVLLFTGGGGGGGERGGGGKN